MKTGQTVYLGPARIEAVFQGIAANGKCKVFQGGRQIVVHKKKVSFHRNKKQTAFVIGEAVNIEIHGIDRTLRGEVVATGPVKARVTEFDPVWNGAVVGTKDARITREEQA